MVISSGSSSSSTSATTLTANRRLSGLVSGLDTDALVKNLSAATQAKIDAQNQKATLLTWKQQGYREIIDTMSNFENKYFSYSNNSSNILSRNFFKTSSIKSSSDLIKASGDTNAAKSMRVRKVTQLASQTRYNCAHQVSGTEPSLNSGYIQSKWKDTCMGDAPLVVKIDDITYTAKLSGDVSIPTEGDLMWDKVTNTERAATKQDVQQAMSDAVNKALKNATYVDSKDVTHTKDISTMVGFSYDGGTDKFSIKATDGAANPAGHTVKLVDYIPVVKDGVTTYKEASSHKLLSGLGLASNMGEKTVTEADGITASNAGNINNYYGKILTAGSYIKVRFRDGTEHNLQISANVDLDTTGKANPQQAFQDALQSALSDAIRQEGLEDDLSVKVTSTGLQFSATGANGLKDEFTIVDGSDNLVDSFDLRGKLNAAYASDVSGTFTDLDNKLYAHTLADSLAGTDITVKLNDASKTITFDEADKSKYDTTEKMISYLQDKLAVAFGDVTYVSGGTKSLGGTPKINVESDGKGGIKITTNEAKVSTDDLYTDASGYYYSDAAKTTQVDAFGNNIKDDGTGKFYKVKADGITLYGEAVTDYALKSPTTDATVKKLELARNNYSVVEMDASDNPNVLGANGSLRIIAGSTNRVSSNQTLKEIADKVGFTQIKHNGVDTGNYGININGKDFEFSESTTLAAALAKINSDTDANITINYSSTKDTMSIIADNYGAQEAITVKEYQGTNTDAGGNPITGDFAQKLFGANTVDNASSGYTKGEDSQLEVSFDNGYTYQTITRSSNAFSIDGVSLELSGVTDSSVSETKPITFSADTQADALFDKIKEFVENYNKVIKSINDKISESKAKDSNGDFSYKPLSEEHRKEMTQTEIDNWEKKAKEGILNNESILRESLYGMNQSISGIVNSSGYKALSKIGISTDPYDWKSGGELKINENTLKACISEDPDAISEIFTNSTDGIATKMKAVLDKSVGTFGGNGSFINYAGKANSRSDTENTISNSLTSIKQKVKELKAKLKKEQDRYYAKFTYMEKVLSSLSSQSNMFAQYAS